MDRRGIQIWSLVEYAWRPRIQAAHAHAKKLHARQAVCEHLVELLPISFNLYGKVGFSRHPGVDWMPKQPGWSDDQLRLRNI